MSESEALKGPMPGWYPKALAVVFIIATLAATVAWLRGLEAGRGLLVAAMAVCFAVGLGAGTLLPVPGRKRRVTLWKAVLAVVLIQALWLLVDLISGPGSWHEVHFTLLWGVLGFFAMGVWRAWPRTQSKRERK